MSEIQSDVRPCRVCQDRGVLHPVELEARQRAQVPGRGADRYDMAAAFARVLQERSLTRAVDSWNARTWGWLGGKVIANAIAFSQPVDEETRRGDECLTAEARAEVRRGPDIPETILVDCPECEGGRLSQVPLSIEPFAIRVRITRKSHPEAWAQLEADLLRRELYLPSPARNP